MIRFVKPSARANDLRAVVWEHGDATDPNAVVSGATRIHLLTVCSVNASGETIGLAVDAEGNYRRYIATPKWEGLEMSAPLRLPDFVREPVRWQMGVARFGLHAATQ